MPKEITYGTLPDFLLMPDGNEITESEVTAEQLQDGKWRRRGVHVGWVKSGKDTEVEVGVASFDPSREMPQDATFTLLDRKGLNRLIRSLQKAGQETFGTDAW